MALVMVTFSQDYYMTLAQAGWIMPYYKSIEVLAILSNAAYILASFRILFKYRHEEKNQFSFQQNPQRFMNLFLVSCLVLVSLWLFNAVKFQWGFSFIKFMRYDFIWSFIPFLTYVIGYYMQRQPELFRINKVGFSKPSSQRLSLEKINAMKESLERLMSTDKVFVKNKLTLSALSEMMAVKSNDLSWLLNESYSSTFYDFINQYRVNEFLNKVADDEHLKHTILGLAMDCGFNTKSTFNKAFKKTTGITPSEYINNLDSGIAAYNKKLSA
jgi:AraC-like DNA-binding protein